MTAALQTRHGPRRWWVLAVLCLSALLVTIDNTIVNVALPTLSRALGTSTTGLQWVVDAYTLLFSGLLLAGGGLGDRLGRKKVLQCGLVLFILACLGAAASSTTDELIAARAAMGVAAALIYPATLALLTVVFTDRHEKATAVGIWSGVSGLAVASGPVAGGVLLRHYSWSSIFLVNIPVAVLALIAGLRLVIGSIMNSVYRAHLASDWSHLGLPAPVITQATQSVMAGFSIATKLPNAGAARHIASDAFMAGMHAGSFAAAAVTAVTAVGALAFLPGREHAQGFEAGQRI